MEKYFRTEKNELVNIVKHTLAQLNNFNECRVRIGTDSQSFGRITRYVTTIVYRYNKNGAHYIYYKEDVPRIRVEYNRLFDEGVRTIEAASLLQEEIPIDIEALEFDFNDTKKTLSNQLVNVFKNWGSFTAEFKSGNMIATKAADHICRK